MAKRFIESGLFRKRFIRGLDAPYKTLFVYYMTECNHAGLWSLSNLDIDSILLGHEHTEEEVKAAFGDKAIVVNGKLFMPSFIDFQYGKLNASNRAHKSVIELLEKEGIDPFTLEIQQTEKETNKPLRSPLQGDKDKDKDKDKVKEEKKEKLPFESDAFREAWEEWKTHRTQIKKKLTPMSAQKTLNKLSKLTETDAIVTINTSIENGWQGLFPERIGGNTGQARSHRHGAPNSRNASTANAGAAGDYADLG